MKSIFIAFLAIFSLISCRNENELDTKNLVGNWDWVSTSGGIGGQTETPNSTGKNIILTFTEDDRYSFTTDGTVTNEGTFSLYKDVSDLSHYEVTFLHFSNFSNDVVINKNEDGELVFSDDTNDGFTYVYHKQ
ncbi:hypothetical protein [Kaistella montana]|uniref:Lipocalin-like domain-containing protein n=1 Tax=Kaistella montana TaxID=1849733 RepID=A0ABW5K785_9FLAO|nr:hypothetical protein [Kaistella montana]MCQ4034362.1 hypothetical protein [Kaistella montana]